MRSLAHRRLLALGGHLRYVPGKRLASTAASLGWPRLQPGNQGSSCGSQGKVAAAAAAAVAVVATSSSALCQSQAEHEKKGSITLQDGRTLSYHSVGQGVPVIALHGMGSSSLSFRQQVPEPGVQLIAMDRPGYGDSTSPPAGYSYTQFVKDLAELADALGLREFCVTGHSSGGPYALAAAALLPQRVVACASISSDPPYQHPRVPPEVRIQDTFSRPCKGVIDRQLEKLGLKIKTPVAPVANYVAWRRSGNVVYISGQIPKDGDVLHKGQLGSTVSVEEATEAARLCGLNLIAQMREACGGDLDSVKQVLQVQGFVSSTSDFTAHPQVINGCSDLLCEVFGKEVGTHSRFAVGCSSLPLGVAVEIGAVIEVEERQDCKASSIGLYGKDPLELVEKFMKKDLASSGQRGQDKKYAWKQGAGGWIADFTLERIPWSFTLEEIKLGPRLTFWVGEKDVPPIIAGTPFMQKLVSGSKLEVVPGGDHGFKSDPKHLSAILQELCRQWHSKK